MKTQYQKFYGLAAGLAVLGASALSGPATYADGLGANVGVHSGLAPATDTSRAGVPAADTDTEAPAVTSSSYVLAPLDQLEILVQGQPDLHQTAQVLADGTITYPIVGMIHASGMTVRQLTEALEKSLGAEYNQPRVTVIVRDSHNRKITVSGAVRSPGVYDYRPGLHLIEVLAEAGGPTQANELTSATVVTKDGTKTIPVDLVKLVNDGDADVNMVMSPGDTVLLSPKDPAVSMIQVVGEVNKPGPYPVMTSGATVLSMLTEAGGATANAALTHVQIMHGGDVKTINLFPLKTDLDDPAGKIKLVQGDTLLIPENRAKYAVLGEIHGPSVYMLPDGEPVSVSLALARAGGPTDNGDKKQVGVLRADKTGKRQLIVVNMDKMLHGDAGVDDFLLQDSDILVVPTRHRSMGLGDYIGQLPGLYWAKTLLGK